MATDTTTMDPPLHLPPGTEPQPDPVLAVGEEGEGVRRRDFINVAALAFAGVGALAVVPVLVNQMSPSADVLALASIEADLSQIQPGQAVTTLWRKQPVFLRNLTPKEIGRRTPSTSPRCAIPRRWPSGPSPASRTG